MPLDPEFEAIVAMMKAVMPPLSSGTLDAMRNAPMPALPVVQVAKVEDIEVGEIAPGVRARLYRADDAPSQPLIVFYHGGGFVMGGLDSHDGFCRQLCAGIGCTLLAVDYRLAPEHKFPAATDDALAALRWAHAHADRLGIDASRIIVAGDSAGGNLAAVTALRCRDEAGPALAGQILFCPVVEFHRDARPSMSENGEGPFLTIAEMAFCTDSYLRSRADAEHPHAAPLRAASLRDLPPALVITAEYDPLRDEGEAYAARLEADGVAVRMTRYDGTIHDFMVMPGPQASEAARRESYAWARARFLPPSSTVATN